MTVLKGRLSNLSHPWWVIGAMFALVLVGGASFATIRSANAAGAAELRIADAIEFRVKFGFNSDPAYVASLDSDPSLSREFGVPLTGDELADMRRRGDTQLGLDALTDALNSQSAFAGLYIDQKAGGVLDIATTGDPAAISGLVDSLAPPRTTVRVHQVQYSMRELKALQDKVTGEWTRWTDAGVKIASVGVDVEANRLRIEVADLTPDIANNLAGSYGDRVEIVAGELAQTGACNSRSDCGAPLKGGLAIDSSNGWLCTSGFLGRKPANLDHMYIILAGHCLQDSGLAANWSHHGVVFGDGTREDYFGGSDADWGIIEMFEPGSKNKFYASSTADIRGATGELTNAQQSVGSTICRAGRTSGYKCGSVNATETSVNVSGTLIDHMYRGDFASNGGDSGGSMFYGTNAAGIFSATSGATSWYSTTDWGLSEIGVRPCYSSLCN